MRDVPHQFFERWSHCVNGHSTGHARHDTRVLLCCDETVSCRDIYIRLCCDFYRYICICYSTLIRQVKKKLYNFQYFMPISDRNPSLNIILVIKMKEQNTPKEFRLITVGNIMYSLLIKIINSQGSNALGGSKCTCYLIKIVLQLAIDKVINFVKLWLS